ncbi:hypothetical protein [uncultured Odoribacter sp.]|uniref:hypothetical protein n=1 Tax=uncultured Odoribacter sp. TaxID=876416 RepID=UPI00260BE014|nr:hypothetical protein [uncultured Odoribacter sp.]
METKELNEKESLELIARMIRNTHDNLETRGGKTMLIYGYTTLFTSIVIYFIVGYTLNPYYYFLWFAIPIVGGIGKYFDKRSHPRKVTTYIDRMVGYVWLVSGVIVWLSACAAFFTVFRILPILFMVAIMINTATIITGLIIKFKALTIGGSVGVILSYSLLIVLGLKSILIFAVIFLFCMIIPGHILQYAERKKRLKSEKHV